MKRYEQIRQMNIDALANLLTSGGNCDFRAINRMFTLQEIETLRESVM